MNLLRNSATKILEGFSKVCGIIISFVRILRAAGDKSAIRTDIYKHGSIRHCKYLLMNLLQGIDSLLQLNVVWGQLGL